MAPAAQAADIVTYTVTPKFLNANTATQDGAKITLAESNPGDFTVAQGIHVNLASAPTGTKFDSNPTVQVTGGTGLVIGAVSHTDTDLVIPVTTASTAKATITVDYKVTTSGTAPANEGEVTAQVGKGAATAEYAAAKRIAFVGDVSRVAGSDRYATAEQIAEGRGCVTPGHPVVIARGDNFPDALAASYLAGVNNVPILLTAPNSMPNETTAALKNIGATSVILIGGTDAISANMATILSNTPAYNCPAGTTTGSNLTVDRAFGQDRYGTARSVALKPGTNNAGTADVGIDGQSCNAVKTAIVASGENFPDALAAGPLAFAGFGASNPACGAGPLPLLLTQSTNLPQITASTLSDLGIKQVILVGGTSAVSTNVETQISNIGGISVKRVSGPDRQGTAVEIAKILGNATLGNFHGGWVFVARPDTFPDALAAAPLAALKGAPLFLAASTTSLGSTAAGGIQGYPSSTLFIVGRLLGGTAALSDGVGGDLANAMAAQSN